MADELQILDGSFKGIPIAIRGGTVEGGPKIVKHSYPSRDTQKLEYLGLNPRSYVVDIVIRSTDYFGYRNRVLAAIESSSTGELIHPLYGRLSNMRAMSFSLPEDFSSFGDATIRVVFEPDDNSGIPQTAGNSVSEVREAQTAVSAAVSSDITDRFNVTLGFTGNFTDAVSKVQSIIDLANASTAFTGEAAEDLNEFSALIGDLSANVNSLVTDPISLGSAVVGLFESVSGLFASADATFQTMAGFFGFGNSDGIIPQDTAVRIERQTNRDVSNGAANALALSYAYLAATEVEIATVLDIDELSATLEAQYQAVVSSGASQDVKDSVTDQRVATLAVLNATRLTAPQVIQVEQVSTTSARLLSFDYYGSDSLGESIAELNNISDVSFVSGQISVVTQ